MNNGDRSREPALVCIAASECHILLIEKMRELGYAVISVDRNPEAPGFKCSDKSLCLSTYEAGPIIEELSKLKDEYDFKGVFTRSSGPPVVTTAVIADHFNLPGATEKAASIIINKCSLMNLCRANGIATPQSRLVDETSFDFIEGQLPCILKPPLGLVGKQGIMLVRKRDEIGPAFQAAKSASYAGEVLLERFVPGDDVVLMSVVFEGKVCPVVLINELNEFDLNGRVMAKGVSMPYKPDENISKSIYDLAQSIVEATGVEYGPFLMACRCPEESVPIPIEIHLDFGGDGILDELFPISTDFDFITYVIGTTLGSIPFDEVTGSSFEFARIGPGQVG